MRQLKKLGPVEFAKVTKPAEFQQLITEIAAFQNVRALALRGEQPFVDDPYKLPFHLAMMRTPGLLHITTLRAGGRLVSAHLNVTRGKEAQLGLISHDPLLHHYSPGKLHILLLAKMLHEEGFAQLDLTPGGESYKERYANDADEVFSLEFHPSRIRRALADVRHRAREFSKRHSTLLGLTPLKARLYQHRARRLGLIHTLQWAFGQLRRQIASTQHTRIFDGAPIDAAVDSDLAVTCCDHVEEMMALARQFAGPDLEFFLADALGRIENGDRLLTLQSTGRLLHFAWLCSDAESQADSHPECRHPVLELPDQLTGQPLRPPALAAFVSYAAASMTGADTVQVIDSSPTAMNATDFESLGLFHTATRQSQTRFGKTRQWTEIIARPVAIPTAAVVSAAPNWRGQTPSAEDRQKIRVGITPNRG